MPTGGGKSLCYQVPALLLPGLTLVVSPLISLMKDQVAALNGVGIPAAFLNSALDAQAFQAVCREIRQGMHKLIYVAPERLLQEGFLALMQGLRRSVTCCASGASPPPVTTRGCQRRSGSGIRTTFSLTARQ